MYSVGDIKKITGISARTLQYYDEIGLLKPSSLTDAGYRQYDDNALEQLQQILFFNELGFQLTDIKQIMSNPDYDKISAYKKQKELLLLKKNRIENLIRLLERLEKGEHCMSFREFDLTEYIKALEDFKIQNQETIIKYWGSLQSCDDFVGKVKQNEESVAKMAIQAYGSIERYTAEMKKNLENFTEIMDAKFTPEVEEVERNREQIFLKILQDRSLDYKSEPVQTSVKELVAFASQQAGNEIQEDMIPVLIDVYTSEYFVRQTDEQYGEGTSEYVAKALQHLKAQKK